MRIIMTPQAELKGSLAVPGDKSISHRAVILGSLARGVSEVQGFLEAEDCLSTLQCMKNLGVRIQISGSRVKVWGRGLLLHAPEQALDAGNSGTTARLLLGVLAGQHFKSTLDGDASLRSRPMGRVTRPLRQMGACFHGGAEKLPLSLTGGNLKPMVYVTPVASGQVKSALLLAGLYARGITVVEEPCASRNHMELMLKQFGARLRADGCSVSVEGGRELRASRVRVPGDISTAAFLLAAACIVPDSQLLLTGVGVNPTRTGIIDVLQEMGADIKMVNRRQWGREPVADLKITGGASLKGVNVGGDMIPRLIDEIPALAVVAAAAGGVTEIKDAGELRFKESDRISSMGRELCKLGVRVDEKPDGMIIKGGRALKGAAVDSCGDHRIAMALAVAGLVAEGETTVSNSAVINISFPGFMASLRKLTQKD